MPRPTQTWSWWRRSSGCGWRRKHRDRVLGGEEAAHLARVPDLSITEAVGPVTKHLGDAQWVGPGRLSFQHLRTAHQHVVADVIWASVETSGFVGGLQQGGPTQITVRCLSGVLRGGRGPSGNLKVHAQRAAQEELSRALA